MPFPLPLRTKLTLDRWAKETYPHRLGSGHDCPVCLDSGETTDPRFARGAAIKRDTPAPVYPCYCQCPTLEGV